MFTDCGSTYLAPPMTYLPGPRDEDNPSLDLNEALELAVRTGAIPMLDPAVTRRTLTRAFGMAADAAAAGRVGARLRV